MNARVLVFSFSAFLLAACGKHAGPPAPESLPALRVGVAKVERVTAPRFQDVTGTVRPIDRAAISSKVTGTITELPIALGQRVAAGEVLARLSAGEINARLQQARASLEQIQRDLARERGLLAKGASTAEVVRVLEDRERISQAALVEAETFLSYTTLKAPFSGVITRRIANEGDLASPGSTLLEIEGTTLRVEAQVPESMALLAPGTPLRVRLGDDPVEGKLAELSPASDPVSRTRMAKIDLPADAPARSGQFARVGWPAGDAVTLRVPAEALTLFGQMERVFVVREGKAQLRLVRAGGGDRRAREILSGLEEGEQVVVSPPPGLRDGQPVEVQP